MVPATMRRGQTCWKARPGSRAAVKVYPIAYVEPPAGFPDADNGAYGPRQLLPSRSELRECREAQLSRGPGAVEGSYPSREGHIADSLAAV